MAEQSLSSKSRAGESRPSTSVLIFMGLVLFLIAVKIFFLLLPTKFPVPEQESALSWPAILIVSLLGFIGLLLSQKTGFPAVWDSAISLTKKLLIPLVIGLGYGLITVLEDLPRPEKIHMKFPFSIPFYAYGAIFLEMLLRLFAIPFLIWLVSFVLFKKKWQKQVFWVAVVLVALYEPLPLMLGAIHETGAINLFNIVYRTLTGPLFLANVLHGYLFKKYGFGATLIMRLSCYLVWHIIYGGLV